MTEKELDRYREAMRMIRKIQADSRKLKHLREQKEAAGTECCCGGSGCCGGGERAIKTRKRKILIEYLYLDLQTCDRCIGTDKVLEEVLRELEPVWKLTGYEVEYRKIEIETSELAEKYEFLSSPTIRVNGRDICETVIESDCGCCGEISGTAVDCRVFEYEGERFEVPPREMLAEAVLRNTFVFGENPPADGYMLPDNLRRFFEGKIRKKER